MAKISVPDGPPPAEPASPGGPGPSVPEAGASVLAAMQHLQPPEAAPAFSTNVQGMSPQFPLVEPAAAFYLVFYPSRWDVFGDRILPQLGRLSGVPGANGVGRADSGQPAMAQALAAQAEQGRLVIPHDIDGPGRSYLRPWQVGWQTDKRTKQTTPIYSWHTRWEMLFIGTADIVTDSAGYAAWMGALIDRGFLPRPPPYVFERLRAAYQSRVATYRGKGNGQHPLVDEYLARLKVVETAMASRVLVPAQPAAGVAPELA